MMQRAALVTPGSGPQTAPPRVLTIARHVESTFFLTPEGKRILVMPASSLCPMMVT